MFIKYSSLSKEKKDRNFSLSKNSCTQKKISNLGIFNSNNNNLSIHTRKQSLKLSPFKNKKVEQTLNHENKNQTEVNSKLSEIKQRYQKYQPLRQKIFMPVQLYSNNIQDILNVPKSVKNINQAKKAQKPSISFNKKTSQEFIIDIINQQKTQFGIKGLQSPKLHVKLAQSIATTNSSQNILNQQISKQKMDQQTNKLFVNLKICQSKYDLDFRTEQIKQESKSSFKILKILDKNLIRVEYSAIDNKLNFICTVKKYSCRHKNLILNELRIYDRLKNHKNILNFYECFNNETQIIVISEYYQNILSNVYKIQLKTLKDCLDCIKQILQAMKYLCQNKICHQTDLQNIVYINGICKLSNFQFAKHSKNLNYQQLKKYYYLRINKIICQIAEISKSGKNMNGEWLYRSNKYENPQKLLSIIQILRNQNLEFEQILEII